MNGAVSATRVVLVLAWRYAREYLRHPATWSTVLLLAASWGWEFAQQTPVQYRVLSDESVNVQVSALLVGAGLCVAALQVAARPSRTGSSEFERVQPLPRWRDTLALMLGILPVAGVVLVLAAARLASFRVVVGWAGQVVPSELITVAAVTLVAGVAGAAAGRILGSIVWGGVALGLLGVAVVVVLSVGGSAAWFGLVAPLDPLVPGPVPTDLMGRPGVWHVLWLALVASALTLTALLRDGLRWTRGVPILLLVVILAFGAGRNQSGVPSGDIQAERAATWGAQSEECAVDAHDRYCAFGEFTGRAQAWRHVVAGVRTRVPEPVLESDSLVVRQVLSTGPDTEWMIPEASWALDQASDVNIVYAPMDWSTTGTGRSEEASVLAFAVDVAARSIAGVPEPERDHIVNLCGAQGVLVLWAAVASDSSVEAAFQGFQSSSSGGAVWTKTARSASGYAFSASEVDVVNHLLDEPRAVAERTVQGADWHDPGLATIEVAQGLGLSAPVARPEGWLCP